MTFNYKKIIVAILLVAISQPAYPGWFSVGSVQNGISHLVGQAKESPVLTGACVAGAIALGYYGWKWYKQERNNATQEHDGMTPEVEQEIIEALQAYQKKFERKQEHTLGSIQSPGSNSPATNSPDTTKYETVQDTSYGIIPENEEQDVPSQPSPDTIRKVIHDLDTQTTENIPDFTEPLSDSTSEEEKISTRIKVPNKDFSPEQAIQNNLVDKQERIRHGNTVLKALLDNTYKNPKEKMDHREDIINVIWAFYGLAEKKGQAFEQGTFVIEDKDFKIFTFLIEYVKRFNEYVEGTAQDRPSVPASLNPSAYCRKSTHYSKEQEKNKQYGIDIRCPETGKALSTLPAQKCHLLFGKIDEEKNFIFIKPEDHGIYLTEVHNHGIEYVKSIGRKASDLLTSNEPSSYPTVESLKALVREYFGSNDAPNFRKEHVPQELIENARKQFDNLFGIINPDLVETLLAEIKAHGFKILFDMKKYPEKFNVNKHKDSFILAINKMIRHFKTKYDHLKHRRGNEVFITAADLANISPEDCEERKFNVSTLDEHSGWNIIKQSPEDIVKSAQKCLQEVNQYKESPAKTVDTLSAHINRISEIMIELNALLMRLSDNKDIWNEFENMVTANLAKCGTPIQASGVYSYLYGNNAHEAKKYSHLTIVQNINNKIDTATSENEKKTLRQLLYFFRSQIMKENFDAYLEGEAVVKNLTGRNISFEAIFEIRNNLGIAKAEIDNSFQQINKKK